MKHSSLIFVGGFTLIFGFFAAESYDADAEALRTAEIRASQQQADLIAEAGCYMAAHAAAISAFGTTTVSINGGTLTYSVTTPPTPPSWPNWEWIGGVWYPLRATAVATGRFGEITIVKRADLEKRSMTAAGSLSWRQWVIKKLYTDPYSLADPTTDPLLANSTVRR